MLLVDDSPYWVDTLAASLRDKGFMVSTVEDGLAAVERMRGRLPDILITDYFLPRLDGGKLCELAKRLSSHAPVTTIILTGGADRNLSRRPSEYADAVIAKNTTEIVVDDLMRAIAALTSSARGAQLGPDVIGHERLRPRTLSLKLHTLKQHMDALHEGIGDAVIGVDSDERIYFLNTMAMELLGVDEELGIARKVGLVLGIDATHPIMRRIETAFQSSNPQPHPLTVELRGCMLRVTVARLKNPLGGDSALLIARDITDLLAAEAERASLTAQLHAADKMRGLGQMTAGISHEINNPLAALMPGLELLQERFTQLKTYLEGPEAKPPPADTEAGQALAEIPDLLTDALSAGQQIKSVVAEMRFFAHPGGNRGEETQLEELVNGALSLISREVRFKARLERDYGETPSLVVDRGLLGQALLNVLINASQAIASGTPETSWIRVKTNSLDSGVAVEISNSGPEVPTGIATEIFEPFYTTKEPGAGVGLGLSIAYETVRRHGGYIELLEGLPTTFRIWLPLDTGKVLTSVRPSAPTAITRTDGQRELRVMVVDDERLVRNGFRRVLDAHYRVTLASSGQEALSLIQQGDYDVILCDLLMPGMTGMQLFTEIQQTSPAMAQRFVFLTGGTASADAREFLREVKNPRAFKPLENEELIALVERAERRTRLAQRANDDRLEALTSDS